MLSDALLLLARDIKNNPAYLQFVYLINGRKMINDQMISKKKKKLFI